MLSDAQCPLMTCSGEADEGEGEDGAVHPNRTTILIVESQDPLRRAVADHLRTCGLDTREALSADDAIRLLEDATGSIDAVFTEIDLPGFIDGMALAEWIDGHCRGLPGIFASDDVGRIAAAQCFHSGKPILVKPYSVEAAASQMCASVNRPGSRPLSQ